MPHNKLTPKQRKLAQTLAKGDISQTQAYKKVYDTKLEGRALRVDACRAANKPNVVLAVEEMTRKIEARTMLDAANERLRLAAILREDCEHPDPKVRHSAIDRFGKLKGIDLWDERKQEPEQLTADEIANQLKTELLSILTQGEADDKVIDIDITESVDKVNSLNLKDEE